MPRLFKLFVNQPLEIDATIVITGSRFHYLHHVLRLKPQDVVMIFNGAGGECEGVIVSIIKRSTTIRVTQFNPNNVTLVLTIELGLGIITKVAMDFVIQQAVELGVNSI